MPGQVPPHIWATSVANLDGISVNKLTQGGSFRKVLIYKVKELSTHPCLYIHTERGVKPNHIPLPFPLNLIASVLKPN